LSEASDAPSIRNSERIPAIFADWSRVIETFGDLMEETDDYPRRYRVREFPDEAKIDAIGLTELG
jgi:hypothetical protein